MPKKELKGRCADVYFPPGGEKIKACWEEHAKAAGLTLSEFILETVEAHLRDKNRTPRNSPVFVDDIQKLREENKLRHIALERAETELFRLKHNIFLQPELRGESAFSKDLVEVLQRGGTWSAHDLLQAMGINPRDAEAIQIVSRQLRNLHSLGVLSEGSRGWRWVG